MTPKPGWIIAASLTLAILMAACSQQSSATPTASPTDIPATVAGSPAGQTNGQAPQHGAPAGHGESADHHEPEPPERESAPTTQPPTEQNPSPSTQDPTPLPYSPATAILHSLSDADQACIPDDIPSDSKLLEALDPSMATSQKSFDLAACLSDEALIDIQIARHVKNGLQPLERASYRCLMEINDAYDNLKPPLEPTEEAQEAGMALLVAMMLTARPIEAYCLTDEERERNMPDYDTSGMQHTNCVIDQLGGPGEFLTTYALMDEPSQARLDASTQACDATLTPQPTQQMPASGQ